MYLRIFLTFALMNFNKETFSPLFIDNYVSLQKTRSMNNILSTGHWIIWFYIIVIFPFQVYDFFQITDKKHKDYIKIIIYSIFAVIAGIGAIESDKDIYISNLAIYILICLAYLQGLIDYFTHKTKRNRLYCCIFTVAILLYIILKIIYS